jgi:hypothetical protein
LQRVRPQVERDFESDKNKSFLNGFFTNSLVHARILGHLADACQVLLLLAEVKTSTKAKAKRVMKGAYTQVGTSLKKGEVTYLQHCGLRGEMRGKRHQSSLMMLRCNPLRGEVNMIGMAVFYFGDPLTSLE